MKSFRENPDGAANQQANKENARYIGGLKLQAAHRNEKYFKLCQTCNGSGEGMRDGSRCLDCKGSGSHFSGYICPTCDQVTDTDFGSCPDCENRKQDEL